MDTLDKNKDDRHAVSILKDAVTAVDKLAEMLFQAKTWYVKHKNYDKARQVFEIEKNLAASIKNRIIDTIEISDPRELDHQQYLEQETEDGRPVHQIQQDLLNQEQQYKDEDPNENTGAADKA